MTKTKKFSFYAILIFLQLAFVELCSYVVLVTLVNEERSFPDKLFTDLTVRNDPELGWTAHQDAPRPSIRYPARVQRDDACVYVFGDSFSHSLNVPFEQSWAGIIEESLGCPTANFAVGGYGTDQAYLRMVRELPDRSADEDRTGNLVLFGIYQEMLRRNMAGSWLFYCCPDKKASLKPYFTLSDDGQPVLTPPPLAASTDAFKQHHKSDWFRDVYEVSFPYTLSVFKKIWVLPSRAGFFEGTLAVA